MSSLISRMQPDDTNDPMVEGWFGAVNPVQRLAEIECAGAERIAFAAGHEARQIGLALDHFRRRIPIRPFRHLADAFGPFQVKPSRPTPMP